MAKRQRLQVAQLLKHHQTNRVCTELYKVEHQGFLAKFGVLYQVVSFEKNALQKVVRLSVHRQMPRTTGTSQDHPKYIMGLQMQSLRHSKAVEPRL